MSKLRSALSNVQIVTGRFWERRCLTALAPPKPRKGEWDMVTIFYIVAALVLVTVVGAVIAIIWVLVTGFRDLERQGSE